MAVERSRVGWLRWLFFWLCWVLASTVGWFVAMYGAGAVLGYQYLRGAEALYGLELGVMLGAGIGILQWLVLLLGRLLLQGRVSRSGWWVLATIVGFAVGGTVGFGMRDVVAAALVGPLRRALGIYVTRGALETLAILVTHFVGGAAAGVLQWLLIREQVSRSGWWWVLASAVAWPIGLAIAEIFAGVVAGAITGIALVWLLRQPAKEA